MAFCGIALVTSTFAADSPDAPANWPLWLDIPVANDVAPAQFALPALRSVASDATWLDRWGRVPPSIAWTDIVLELIVKYQQNPLRTTRTLALLHAAMHDALALCSRNRCQPAESRIAQHTAAGRILKHMYPQESPGRFEALARSAALASVIAAGFEENTNNGWRWGVTAAKAAIARALDDGADRPRDLSARPRERPGIWRATPPLNIYDPGEPRAGEWRTWVLKSGPELEPPPPVEYGSAAYWAEAEEVWRVGNALTAEQKKIAEEWNLDLGTVTPAGVWNLHARREALARELDMAQTTRLFAALNVAMTDALISCWSAKFRLWTQRPITAIREKFDAKFLPHIITPPFPSYVSGHSELAPGNWTGR